VAAFLSRALYTGISPIVLIRTHECPAGTKCAEITGAVRELQDIYGLAVIVDGSPNSLDDSLFHTTRQRVSYIQPFTREEIYTLPQFQELPEVLKKDTELCDIIWEVMGGIPSQYDILLAKTKNRTPEDALEGIKQAIEEELQEAWKAIRDAKVMNPDMKQILALFKKEEHNLIPISSLELENKMLRRSSPDNVLQEITQEEDGNFILVPATNAIALILRYDFQQVPTFKGIKERLIQK